MAYMSQEKKAKIAVELKKVMPKGWKYSLAVRNHSTIVCTIKSAPVDLIAEVKRVSGSTFVKDDYDVNPYHPHVAFDKNLKNIEKILTAMNLNNHNNSDIQTDYFDVGHYVDLNIGKWNKPFVVA